MTSRKPLWLDLQSVDIKSRWRHNWKSAEVVNSHLVCDPTIRQPDFDLPRQQWSLLNRFRTEQGHCGACTRKWRLTDTDLCPCGETDDVSHCRILSPNEMEWRLISATLCGWRRCFVADQLWFMTCMREEEDRYQFVTTECQNYARCLVLSAGWADSRPPSAISWMRHCRNFWRATFCQRALCVCGVHTSVRLSVKLSMRLIAMRYHMLNFIAIDLQLYKRLKFTLVSYL